MNVILQAYTVAYHSAFDLVDELAEAATISAAARRKRIAAMVQAQLLIIDEFGMRSHPGKRGGGSDENNP
jgi:DNA replication protein DnaC